MNKKVIHMQIPIDEYGRMLVEAETINYFKKQLKDALPEGYEVVSTPFMLEELTEKEDTIIGDSKVASPKTIEDVVKLYVRKTQREIENRGEPCIDESDNYFAYKEDVYNFKMLFRYLTGVCDYHVSADIWEDVLHLVDTQASKIYLLLQKTDSRTMHDNLSESLAQLISIKKDLNRSKI